LVINDPAAILKAELEVLPWKALAKAQGTPFFSNQMETF